MHYDVLSCQVVGPHAIEVAFRDGLTGMVVMEESHCYGVFEPLRDPAVFSEVRCDQGFLSWGETIDLAPDAMYNAIQKHGQWVLT